MTAPRSVCRNTKKVLAERGPSIHDETGCLKSEAGSRSCPGRGAACFYDAPQSRDPRRCIIESWAPDQQRTTPKGRAALHPGNDR